MQVLIVFAFLLTGIVLGMTLYLKSHPPEASVAGVLWLQQGLRLGTITSATVFLLYVEMFYFPPVSPTLFWPLTIISFIGNISNLASLALCLRERNAESLFAAFLILLSQFLWILYAIRAVTIDF